MDGAGAAIELGALIDGRPMAPVQILVACLCAVALFIDGYDIQGDGAGRADALAGPGISRRPGSAWRSPRRLSA